MLEYQPDTDSWEQVARMKEKREGHAALVVPCMWSQGSITDIIPTYLLKHDIGKYINHLKLPLYFIELFYQFLAMT